MKTQQDKRLELQQLFVDLLDGMHHAYFQPPSSIKMQYPAIVYSRNGIDKTTANNDSYLTIYSYKVTVIDEDPDSEFVEKVSKLPKCSFNTHYVADNLNHDVFTLYY